ncbi:MAG: ThiF family adenylyltransferase [Gammaproteobacteria bacterium]|nr:ThiF family adenylyltransferase [Gammaproteobacteria bacterium]
MSQSPISLSPDLRRLADEGFEVAVESGHLVLRGVPYVNAAGQVCRGTLVSTLDLAGDRTARPGTHVVMFAGAYPCDSNGRELDHLRHGATHTRISDDLVVDFSFSSKPPSGYADYHHKMSTYADMISAHAEALDPIATARTRRVLEPHDPEDVFNYLDTASSRAGMTALSDKLRHLRIAIVGLGGTGSYVLDYVAKTPVLEIHLVDDDDFLQHNAFRSPGAPSLEELRAIRKKVEHHAARYGSMRKRIHTHALRVDASNADALLGGMDMVFVCVDRGDVKAPIVDALERLRVPFIDVGMGLELTDHGLCGIVRTTTSTPGMRDHVRTKGRMSFDGGGDGVYSHNIQIAELNALNAALAVIKWKKLAGVYLDLEHEHFSAYTLDGNSMVNEDPSE